MTANELKKIRTEDGTMEMVAKIVGGVTEQGRENVPFEDLATSEKVEFLGRQIREIGCGLAYGDYREDEIDGMERRLEALENAQRRLVKQWSREQAER